LLGFHVNGSVNGGNLFLYNFCKFLPHYIESQPRRQYSSQYSSNKNSSLKNVTEYLRTAVLEVKQYIHMCDLIREALEELASA
jgi:hypothetical protein